MGSLEACRKARVFKDRENTPGFMTVNRVLDGLPDSNQLDLFSDL